MKKLNQSAWMFVDFIGSAPTKFVWEEKGNKLGEDLKSVEKTPTTPESKNGMIRGFWKIRDKVLDKVNPILDAVKPKHQKNIIPQEPNKTPLEAQSMEKPFVAPLQKQGTGSLEQVVANEPLSEKTSEKVISREPEQNQLSPKLNEKVPGEPLSEKNPSPVQEKETLAVAPTSKPSFVGKVWENLKDVGRLYAKVGKEPQLVLKGMLEVLKDIFYEIPKSLLVKKASTEKSREQKLSESASGSLVLSDLIAIPGTFAGVLLFEALGQGAYVSGTVGAVLGSYLTSALSYLLSYTALSRVNVKDYPLSKGFSDGVKVIRDCLPASAALYLTNSSIVSGLMALGLSSMAAVSLVTVIGTVVFMGVAKLSVNDAVEKKEAKPEGEKVEKPGSGV